MVNKSELSSSALKADLPYLQQYVNQVCEAWHCAGHLYFGAPKSARDWVVTFNNVSDVQNAIGYHTEAAGVPEAFVSVQTAVQYHFRWGVVATHELAEMLVDPEATSADNTRNECDIFNGCTNATFYAREVCDPVQSETYRLGPLHVSDFVYRNWFEPDAPGPYDAGRHLGSPLSLAPSSYMIVYRDGAWQEPNTFPKHFGNWDRFGPELH